MKNLIISAMLLGSISTLTFAEETKCDTYCEYLKKVQSEIKTIEVKELGKMIALNTKMTLIDIRDDSELENGKLNYPNLKTIPRAHLEAYMEETVPDKSSKVVLICNTGKRSALSAKSLMDMGYTDVVSVNGGTKAWVAAGKPLVTTYGLMKKAD